jgi:predicted helicase
MTKKAEIYYVTLTDEMLREDKLAWFKHTRFDKLPFEKINPDDKENWLNLTDNDFESLLPLVNKEVKAGKGEQAVFKLFSSGVKTQRDDWVYDFDKNNLENKMRFFVDIYQATLKDEGFKDKHLIKFDRELDKYLQRNIEKIFEENCVIKSIYRPFIKMYFYFDKHFNGMTYQWFDIFNTKNNYIAFNAIGGSKVFHCLVANNIIDLHLTGDSQCLPLYVYDKDGNPHDNITDWALSQFQNHYQNLRGFKNLAGLTKADTFQQSEFKPGFELQKLDIFHYAYAVLHNPAYREKYQQNLKREFPRIPFYDDFMQWA